MKKHLALALSIAFISSAAFAVPDSAQKYTYESGPDHNYVHRLPDDVWIPVHETGAFYDQKVEDAQGNIITTRKVYVTDPENEDLVEYKKWLKAGNKPAKYVPTAPPAPDEKKELQKQLDILELKAKIKELQDEAKNKALQDEAKTKALQNEGK